MKVVHIIPGAFNYFDDIRQKVFGLLDDLDQLGIMSEAFVLEYNTVHKEGEEEKEKEKEHKKEARHKTALIKPRKFQETMSVSDMLAHSEAFDIVHLHMPFFGAGHAIRRWRAAHPHQPFVISYHRPVDTPDMFSLFVLWYNTYYQPKLIRTASVILSSLPNPPNFIRQQKNFVAIDATPEIFGERLSAETVARGITAPEIVAWKHAVIYAQLVQQ